ncbi:MAG TPA: DUF533 domain-containing protein [Anaeromyxobacteraceae bacterium]|nr:DUF533 domain-containing protein [Anaeromyxobacteraceae bacterium]
MLDQEHQAVLEICIMAAMADASDDERERAAVKRVADSLARESGTDLVAAYQDLLLGKRSLEDAAARIRTPEVRQLAHEMAVVVCDADGAQVPAERAFLERLRSALGLDAAVTRAFSEGAESLATAPLETTVVRPPPLPGSSDASAPPAATPPPMTSAPPTPGARYAPVDEAALDQTIERHALLAGALELLPQSMATMAIIPLQMKLVHSVGKAYGVELDQGHVKEFLATAGAGLASQYVEQFGRKLLGGLFRGAGGRVLGGLGQAATGSAITFGTTWAIGQIAKRYYAGGRRLDSASIRETFQALVAEGRALGERYVPEMQRRASGIDAARIIDMVRQV